MNFRISVPGNPYLLCIPPNYTPSGAITPFAGNNIPGGYLLCDGSEVSRATFARLFSVISTLYGSGDGSTTFNLPNLVSRFPIGASLIYPLSSAGGSFVQNLTSISQIPAHNHGINDPGHNHVTSDPGHIHGLSDPSHSHAISDPGHSHSSNAIGGQGNLGLCVADGSNTVVETDSSNGELNVWTTPSALTINSNSTGITVNSNSTGITVNGNSTGITINSNSTGITTQNTGGSPTTPFSILNPYLSLNYIIKI